MSLPVEIQLQRLEQKLLEAQRLRDIPLNDIKEAIENLSEDVRQAATEFKTLIAELIDAVREEKYAK